ncbi:MAG: response regulator [Tepidisphaeraceae bacterium]
MIQAADERKQTLPTAAQAEPVRLEEQHGPRSPSGRVLLTEVTEARRGVIAAVLQERGHDVANCADSEAVMRRAKTVTPDVVILDVELPHGQPEQCLRALKRCYQTSSVSIVLACPKGFDRRRLAELIQEGGSAILTKPYTRQQLLEIVQAAIERARTLRADMAIELGAQSVPSQRVESNNSLFSRPIFCVMHNDRPQLTRYLLRPGSVAVESDYFGLPNYKPVGSGHDPVDFNLLSVMVCPKCLFASAHAGYFLDPADRKARRHHVDSATLRALEANAAFRQELFAKHSPEFFSEKRNAGDARLALELAVRCSNILHDQNRFSLSMELLRLGNYHLSLAKLSEESDPAAARKHRMTAVDPLKRAISVLGGAGRAKAAHQLVALGAALGDPIMARHYLTLLADLEADAPLTEKEEIQPYLQRARDAMEHLPKA